MKYGNNISEFVLRYRREKSLTQAELGESMGIHPQYVSNVERGVDFNPVSFCIRLLKVVGVKRRPYLMDMIQDAAGRAAFNKIDRRSRALDNVERRVKRKR